MKTESVINMTRINNGTVAKSIYVDNTWAGQYLGFHDFALWSTKDLDRNLFKKAR